MREPAAHTHKPNDSTRKQPIRELKIDNTEEDNLIIYKYVYFGAF
jgi:hypothetical protein